MEEVKFLNGMNFSLGPNHERKYYNLRRHCKTVHREQVKYCLSRFQFFVKRVINNWNKIPNEVIKAKRL